MGRTFKYCSECDFAKDNCRNYEGKTFLITEEDYELIHTLGDELQIYDLDSKGEVTLTDDFVTWRHYLKIKHNYEIKPDETLRDFKFLYYGNATIGGMSHLMFIDGLDEWFDNVIDVTPFHFIMYIQRKVGNLPKYLMCYKHERHIACECCAPGKSAHPFPMAGNPEFGWRAKGQSKRRRRSVVKQKGYQRANYRFVKDEIDSLYPYITVQNIKL